MHFARYTRRAQPLALALLVLWLAGCAAQDPAGEAPPAAVEPPPLSQGTPAEARPEGAAGASPDNPVAYMETLRAPDWEVRLLEVARGEQAAELLAGASSFNDPPQPGFEYLLARVAVSYVGAADTAHAYARLFRVLDGGGELVPSLSFVDVEVPEPALEADLRPGEAAEGWIAFEVSAGQTGLLLVLWPYQSYENGTALFVESTPKWYLSLAP